MTKQKGEKDYNAFQGVHVFFLGKSEICKKIIQSETQPYFQKYLNHDANI